MTIEQWLFTAGCCFVMLILLDYMKDKVKGIKGKKTAQFMRGRRR